MPTSTKQATKTTVYITTQFTAYHKWENAPADVSFLKNVHRHIFHVKVCVPVSHNDRDVEFFQFKSGVDSYINTHYQNRQFNKSCEMIASELLHEFGASSVEVSEDKENGAIVECVCDCGNN